MPGTMASPWALATSVAMTMAEVRVTDLLLGVKRPE
jgi:hypothetical protein